MMQESKGCQSESFEIPLSWDVVDFTTRQHLGSYVSCTHQIDSLGYSIFKLSWLYLGLLGEIVLTKKGEKLTEIFWSPPPKPENEDIDKYWTESFLSYNREEIGKEFSQKVEELHKKRKDHFCFVKEEYLYSLVHDFGLWNANHATPPNFLLERARIGVEAEDFVNSDPKTISPVRNETANLRQTQSRVITFTSLKKDDYWRWLKDYLLEKKLSLYWEFLSLFSRDSSQGPKCQIGEIKIDWNFETKKHSEVDIETWTREIGTDSIFIDIEEMDNAVRTAFKYPQASVWLIDLIMKESYEKFKETWIYWPENWPKYPGDFPPFERMPAIEEVDSCVFKSLNFLDPMRYEVKRERVGDYVCYSVSFKEGILIGKYAITPGSPGGSIYSPEKEEYQREWDTIWRDLIWVDVQRRYGRFPWSVEASQPATIDHGAGQVKEPPKPPEPKERGGKVEVWLDWYHEMLDGGFKCTLPTVAKKSNYSYGYIKQLHSRYIKERGLKPN